MESNPVDLSEISNIKDPVSRLNAILKIWRDKLVAFDGRNRQLYYRKLKSGDVDFEDPYLDTSALNMLLSGKTVKSIKELMRLTEEYEEEKSVTNLLHRKTKKD